MTRAATSLRRFGTVAPKGRGLRLSAFDQAARGGRSIFPSRVFDPDEVGRVLKSGQQSRKIGAVCTKGARAGWPIFTLTLEERATCPRSCRQWLDCYGNNMQAAERIVGGPELEESLAEEVAALAQAHPAGFMVRLHVLGDFYAPGYVALWARLLEQFPALHLFGFTAHAPDTPMGRAVALLAGDFGWGRAAIRFSGQPHAERAARVVAAGEHDPDAVACPAQEMKTDCCATCALCWHSTRSIAFRVH